MSKRIISEYFFLEEDEQETLEWEKFSLNEYISYVLFEDKVFIHETSYISKGKIIEVVVVFYPDQDKTFIVDKMRFNQFKNDYFRNKTLIKKEPSFYVFLIPQPFGYYDITNNRFDDLNMVLISNTSFKNTYESQNILRLSGKSKVLFNVDYFDPVFQSSFQNIFEFSEDFKTYLSEFLLVDKSLIKTNKLVRPYYKLSSNDVMKLCEFISDLMAEAYEEELKNSELNNAGYHDKKFSSELDELNWIALERDISNYWNID